MKTLIVAIVALLTVSVAKAEGPSHAAAALMAGLVPASTAPAASTEDVNAKIQRAWSACMAQQPGATSPSASSLASSIAPSTSLYR